MGLDFREVGERPPILRDAPIMHAHNPVTETTRWFVGDWCFNETTMAEAFAGPLTIVWADFGQMIAAQLQRDRDRLGFTDEAIAARDESISLFVGYVSTSEAIARSVAATPTFIPAPRTPDEIDELLEDHEDDPPPQDSAPG